METTKYLPLLSDIQNVNKFCQDAMMNSERNIGTKEEKTEKFMQTF